ncbi:Uncharacterised protein [Gordonia bronchialis]|nr:Uncharacterised protein [Gordonia bronchialis]
MWFAGESPHGVLLPLPGGGEVYTYWGDDWSDFEDGAALLRLGRRESEKLATLSRKKGERHKAEERGASDAEMALLATDISALEKDIREIRETVRRLGGEPGHLGPAHSYLDGREV